MKFNLYEDVKVCTWRRYSYEVEAETLEEAVGLVREGEVESTNMDEFYDADYFLTPTNNDGHATQEIYSAEDDKLLYSNAK